MKVESGIEGRRARIEIIALIDVVFLLLVFFIYAMLSMTVQRGVAVSLPAARGEVQVETLTIILDRQNRLSLEGREGSPEEIARLAGKMVATRKLPVLIRGDRRADLGVAVELLARLREQGLEAVSFQAREGPAETP